jgi:hypothetical protein
MKDFSFFLATKWFALLISRALAFYGILGFESRLFKNNSSFILVNEFILLFFSFLFTGPKDRKVNMDSPPF